MAGLPVIPTTDGAASSASGADGQALARSFIGTGDPVTLSPNPVAAVADRLRGLFRTGRKVIARSPGHNPGHVVKAQTGGLFSASSSAPRNPRQHVNLAPPSHQRFDPSAHPSAMRAVLTVGPEMLELIQ